MGTRGVLTRSKRRSVTLLIPNGKKHWITRATARTLLQRGHTILVSECPFVLALRWWALGFYQSFYRWQSWDYCQGRLLMKALRHGQIPADFSAKAARTDSDLPYRWGREELPAKEMESLRRKEETLFLRVCEWERKHRRRFPARVLQQALDRLRQEQIV